MSLWSSLFQAATVESGLEHSKATMPVTRAGELKGLPRRAGALVAAAAATTIVAVVGNHLLLAAGFDDVNAADDDDDELEVEERTYSEMKAIIVADKLRLWPCTDDDGSGSELVVHAVCAGLAFRSGVLADDAAGDVDVTFKGSATTHLRVRAADLKNIVRGASTLGSIFSPSTWQA